MEQLFTKLTKAIEGTPLIAMGASFLWGMLSILLSPCHLTSIPLLIGVINDRNKKLTIKRTFLLSLLFAIGILLTISLIGLITASMGRIMGDIGRIGNYIVAIVLLIVGLYLLEIVSFDWKIFPTILLKDC